MSRNRVERGAASLGTGADASPSWSGASARARSSTACARSTPGRSRQRRASALLTTVCCAWRWKIVARGLGVDLSLPAAVAAYYRSQFLNVTLPGGVVGDVHRGVSHGRDVSDVGRGLRAVAWERFAGQVVQVVLTVVVLLVLPSPVHSAMPLVAIAARASRRSVVVLVARVRPGGGRSAPARVRAARRRDIRDALLARRAWPGIALASALVVAGHALTFVIAARTAGTTAPPSQMLPIALLVMMAMVLPSVGGWGPREGVTAWAFAAAGLGAQTRGHDRGRLRRHGARRQPARAPPSSWWHGSVVPGFRSGANRRSGREQHMPDRPYILLSCALSIDGYLGSAAPRRLELSNDADFDRVDAVRASCDAILVGAATVRTDNPRLLVRSQDRRDERTARGLPPSPIKVTVTERVELDPGADFFTTGDDREARLLREPARGRRPLATRTGGDRGRRRPAGEDAPPQRGPRRARRAAADGRGRRQGAHPVPDRQSRRRAAAGRRARSSSATPGPRGSSATAASRGTPTGARRSPRSARSAMWCCCATRSRRASRPTDREIDAATAHRDDPHPGVGAPAVRRRVRHARAGVQLRRAGRRPGARRLRAGRSGRPARVRASARGRRWSGRTASASPGTCSAANGATAGRSCARPSSGSPTPVASCCTCGRRDAASACTPSSTPTRCRTRGWTPTRRTSRWATARTNAATSSPRRCCARWGCRGSPCSATTRTRPGSFGGSG